MPGSQGNSDAPHARRAGVGHLEHRRPFHRIGDVGVHGEAVTAEIVGRAHDEELLGPGEALELDRQELCAPCCGRRRRRSATTPRRCPGMPSDSTLHLAGDSACCSKPVTRWPKCTCALGLLAQDVELDRRQPVLLEVQAVGIGGDVGEQSRGRTPPPCRRAGCGSASGAPAARAACMLLRDAVCRHHVLRRRMKEPARRSCVSDGSASHTTT